MLLCSANMLDHAGLGNYASMIRDGLKKVLKEGKVRTKDIGGYATTREFTEAVVKTLQASRE